MKVTVVPAEVTTVEDRIAGNLSFLQLILLVIPMFGGSLLYTILPPFAEISPYKLLLIGILGAICVTLALRIKGKVVLLWLVTFITYTSRPRHYVLNKNNAQYRQEYPEVLTIEETAPATAHLEAAVRLDTTERATLLASLNNPLERLTVELTKKGGLNVRISEAKE